MQDWGLFKANIGKPAASLSNEDILSALKSKDTQLTQYKPNDLPWIDIQRPNCTCVLYFKKIHSKRMKTLRCVRTESEVGVGRECVSVERERACVCVYSDMNCAVCV